jgi:hypothetical protein
MNKFPIQEALQTAKGIAWDTCHKIYVLMDDEQMEIMRSYGYEALITANTTTPEAMLATIEEWFDSSCALRFVQSVSTEDGFNNLIEQFQDEDGDDD